MLRSGLPLRGQSAVKLVVGSYGDTPSDGPDYRGTEAVR